MESDKQITLDPIAAYRAMEQPEPPEMADARIRRSARRAIHRPWLQSPGAIWPLSAAAAILVSVGIFSQMAVRTPAPGYPQVQMPGPPSAPNHDALPPEPPAGQLSETPQIRGASGTIEARSKNDRTALNDAAGDAFTAARERLIELAERRDLERFPGELNRFRAIYPDADLPELVQLWERALADRRTD